MTEKQFNPFLFYSMQLQVLFVKAAKQKNPALWLYENNVRTPLFMLEALTRLHDNAFDEVFLNKWHLRFKKLEDEFGLLDYYVAFEKEFAVNKKVTKPILANFTQNVEVVSGKINSRLKDKDWLSGKLLKFNVKLSQYTLFYDEEHITELRYVIEKDIEKIKAVALKLNYSFTEIELEVHEMRRKLRWISIYAQALNGIIQSKPTSKKVKYTTDYLTKDIVKSPYNKLPAKPKNTAIMEYDSDSFFALSWVIKELGTLKDNGLRIEALADAIQKVEKTDEQQATEKAIGLLGVKKDTIQVILKQASDLMYNFIVKDKILDTLLIKKTIK
jgi:hypothetical protein